MRSSDVINILICFIPPETILQLHAPVPPVPVNSHSLAPYSSLGNAVPGGSSTHYFSESCGLGKAATLVPRCLGQALATYSLHTGWGD